jgi:peroxiredoxin
MLYAFMGIVAFLALKAYQNRDQRFVGTIPQEFSVDGSWLNANQPLRLADLRGKVVLLQFSFINCPYCREMDPYLHKWHNEFSSDGLVIVEIDDGSTDSLDELRRWAAHDGINYPVFYDVKGRMCASYGIESFPTLLLIGRDGKVVSEGYGWGGNSGIAKLENQIRAALKKATQ